MYCDYLVVGVHRDGSHKGKNVFIPFEERMEIVKNISFVDRVIESEREDSDVYTKGIVHYDLLFVGSDYKGTDTCPRGVIRLSPATDTELPPCPTVMERNLYIVKSLPPRPTRLCLKITGPPGILTFISTATTASTGHSASTQKESCTMTYSLLALTTKGLSDSTVMKNISRTKEWK